MQGKRWLISGICLLSLVGMMAVGSFAEEIDVFKQHGAVSWYELSTSDVDAATQFYTQLFGWTTETTQMADGSKYVSFKVNNQPIGGIMKTPSQAQGVPPYWGLYVTVNDVDATVKQAQEAGGKIVVPPMDIPEAFSRFSIIQDPQGAVIGVIKYLPNPQQPAPAATTPINPQQQHGAVSFVELLTTDLDAATKFYTPLFGWTTESSQMTNGETYISLKLQGKLFGGFMSLPANLAAQGVPPNWGIYVTVKDTDATAKQAQALGGRIVIPPTDVVEINGRFCVIQDPQGAVLSLMTYKQAS
jgi:uncharacterized protein